MIQKRGRKTNTGFTIVELLIVVVVIAILAAITLISYNGIQSRARVSTVQNDFGAVSKKVELFKIDSTTASYPSSAAELISAGVTLSKSNYDAAIYCSRTVSGVVQDWLIAADAKNGKTYVLKKDQAAISEYTNNKVQGVSGGTTCPTAAGSSGWGWTWLLQVPNGSWTI